MINGVVLFICIGVWAEKSVLIDDEGRGSGRTYRHGGRCSSGEGRRSVRCDDKPIIRSGMTDGMVITVNRAVDVSISVDGQGCHSDPMQCIR